MMNVHSLIAHARLYLRSEVVVAEIWAGLYARKLSFFAIALLTGIMALAFINLALYAYLLSIWGAIWTPFAIGLGNVLLAVAALFTALRARPSKELKAAEEIRKLCADSFEEDFQFAGSSASGFASQGTHSNAQLYQLLIPAIASIIGAMRRRKATPKK
jgi:hypothetical protein